MEATSKAVGQARVRSDALLQLRRRFDQWRARRRVGTRIPSDLWAGAVAAASEHGAYRVAAELHLDYTVLKRRAGLSSHTGKAPTTALMPQFVEVFAAGGSPTSAPSRPQCVVELHSARGAKMRVELNADALAGLSVLCTAFWGAR
jgi:hypothetical protein